MGVRCGYRVPPQVSLFWHRQVFPDWCRTVIRREKSFCPHRTLMVSLFFLLTFRFRMFHLFHCIVHYHTKWRRRGTVLKIWSQCDDAMTSTWRQSHGTFYTTMNTESTRISFLSYPWYAGKRSWSFCSSWTRFFFCLKNDCQNSRFVL